MEQATGTVLISQRDGELGIFWRGGGLNKIYI